MTFLLLNQTFYPDVSATGQYLTDVALGLASKGHLVTVITSRRSYDAPGTTFLKKEIWEGLKIVRVASTWFGKPTRWGRALDALSFLASCSLRLVISARPDVVLALTSPPMISFVAACFATFRRCKLCYWVMDLNPDEAIAAGWLRKDSIAAKILDALSVWSMKRSAKIIALDRFMRERIVARGGPPERTIVLPLWSQDSRVRYDPEARQRFRAEHGLEGKFVVMYSGNHSPCHPLESLLLTAESLASDPHILFCFIGGGSEWRKLKNLRANLLLLPYEPLDRLSASLSAADLHVVVMGEPFVGLVHPCKPYNLLRIGAPLLYIGPMPSHVMELWEDASDRNNLLLTAKHGEVQRIAEHILRVRAEGVGRARPEPLPNGRFSQTRIVPKLIDALESSKRTVS